MSDTLPTHRPRWRHWPVYTLVGSLLLLELAWVGLAIVQQIPAREAVVNLAGYGGVTAFFSTNPSPPRPLVPVNLNFKLVDAQQRPMPADNLWVAFGRDGNESVIGYGSAEQTAGDPATFVSRVEFPEFGHWWVRIKVQKDTSRAEARFSVYVDHPTDGKNTRPPLIP